MEKILVLAVILSVAPITALNDTEGAVNVTEVTGGFNVTEDYGNLTEKATVSANVTEAPDTDDRKRKKPWCPCDQSYGICDVNCCCDTDCSVKDIETFSRCTDKDTLKTGLGGYCLREDSIFTINTPYTWDRAKAGLLCVHLDNFPQRFEYVEAKVAGTEAEFEELSKRAGEKWFWPNPAEDSLNVPRGPLKAGHPMFAVSDEETVGYFVLPRRLSNGVCSHSSPVKYLTSEKDICSEPIKDLKSDCEKNPRLKSSTYFETIRILKTPFSNVNASVKAVPVSCEGFAEDLWPCDDKVPLDPSYVNSACLNVAEAVEYVITHNGSEGVVHVQVKIKVGDIKRNTTFWTQRFETNFRWTTDPPEGPLRRSGHPGYLTGQPILAGKLVTNRTKEAVLVSTDRSNTLTVPRANADGSCAGPSQRTPILFGEDTVTGCTVDLGTEEECWAIGERAMEILVGPDPPDRVGTYGDSDQSDVDQWAPVLAPEGPQDAGKCTGFVGRVEWVFEFARVGVVDAPVVKIVGVRRVLGMPVDVRAGKTFLTVTVSFTDVTEKPVAEFAPPPSLDLHFPADLFYPFFASNAVSHGLRIQFLVMVGTASVILKFLIE